MPPKFYTFRLHVSARDRLQQALVMYEGTGLPGVFHDLLQHAAVGHPSSVLKLLETIRAATRELQQAAVDNDTQTIEVHAVHAPVLLEALKFRRRQLAAEAVSRASRVHGEELRGKVDYEVRAHDEIMKQSWVSLTERLEVPALVDYFPTRAIERLFGKRPKAALDDKFNILYAASSFHTDLEWTRRAHELRGLSLAVAFVDIDDFKSVNEKLGEPIVDREVLPIFQTCLEAHVYKRGRAYKIGGDESLLILENVDGLEDATASMFQLQDKLAKQKYPAGLTITASVGLILVAPRCHLSGAEIESLAAIAKKAAKKSGKEKSAVARYNDEAFSKAVVVARPPVKS